MFNYFNYFDKGFIFGVSKTKYNPYINYSWSQTLTVEGNQQIKDTGTAGLNLQQFFGQGVWFNGIDMQITIPVNATIQTEIKRVNGVTEINTNTQNLTNYNVYSGSGAKVYKDLYMFNRALTPTEIEKYSNQPNEFFMDSLEDDSCILAIPMCEKNNLVRNYKNNTDYQITNYLTACRTNAQRLPYGLQTSGFKRDSNGLILSKSNFLEADGVGYGDTGYNITPLEEKTIEFITTERTGVLSDFGSIIGNNTNQAALYSRFNTGFSNKIGINCNGYGYTEINFINKVYIAIVINTNGYTVYKDGVAQGFKHAQGGNNSGMLQLCSTNNSNQILNNCHIRLFKVHQKALTQEEITKNFNKYQAQGLLNE